MAQPAYKFPEEKDGPSWPAQGEWTYEDYLRLPEDGNRYEVIRGVLYVSPAPLPEHQYAASELIRLLRGFVSRAGLGIVLRGTLRRRAARRYCQSGSAGRDVLPERERATPGDASKVYRTWLLRSLSPRTRRRDRTVKLQCVL